MWTSAPWSPSVTPGALTVRAPVSVTTAAPSRIETGTSATVTLTGRHLCDLEFTTGHAGVSFSNVVFDPVAGAGTSASVRVTVASTAPAGVATVTVHAGDGTASFDVTIPPDDVVQPTTFSIDTPTNPTAPLEGYAGVDTMVVTVGNGTNMSLDLRYTLDNGDARTGNIQLDADGGWSQDLAHNLSTGTYVYTEMKNTLLSTWVDISPDVTYTVHPPQPTSMSVSQPVITTPLDTATPLIYTMDVGNGAGVTLDVQYTLTPPGGATGPVQTLESWPSLVSAGGTRPDDGTANIFASGCTLPGVYQFTAAKNTLNMDSDPATDLAADGNWVTVTPDTLTLSALVSVTSAAPSRILAGTSATVTLTGTHLCGLTLMLETDYPGVTLSNVMFDPPSGAGRTATVVVTVDATAAAGVATVTVGAGEGTATFDLTIVGEVIDPTTFSISTPADPDAPLEGFAGVDTVAATVGNGANMSLDLRYTLNGTPRTGNIQLDADAQWSQVLPQNIWTGVFVYTEMKNALGSTWVDIPDVTYTVRPPQPKMMSVSPPIITTPAVYTIDVENGAGVRLDVQYTLTPPGETISGPVQTLQGWPSLVSAGGASPDDGTVDIFASGCTLPGVYQFTAAKNTLNMDSDPATDLASDATWEPMTPGTLTLSAPVSVTSAAPSTIPVGTSATVTLRGAHLCALALSTTYAGVTFSDLVFDPVQGEGAMATVRVTVAATAAEGMAPVTVQAGEGTATFNLTIGPVTEVPGDSPLRREYIYLGGRVIAVESP